MLTKAALMEHFDEVVTDPSVRLKDVEEHVARLTGPEKFHNRYWVCTTGGTTGRRGVFLFNFWEWTSIISSYARSEDWGGAQAGLMKRMRLAVVSSTAPWHQSARVGATVSSWWVPTLRIDAAEKISLMVEKLNEWQPEALVGYPSVLAPLAAEQLAGRLTVRPRSVFSASEVLTEETRQRIEQAWGTQPFNVYGATETATIASDCEYYRMHLFEDLVITEVVDEQARPVPPGTFGSKVLVTVLFSRTLPLIRYEMSDSIAVSTDTCPCGRVFRLVQGIQGRAEDVLWMPGRSGSLVQVHPNLFHRVMESLADGEWQIVQTAPDELRVLITGSKEDTISIGQRIGDELLASGIAHPKVTAEVVEAIPRTAASKAPLIRSEVKNQGKAK